MGIARHDLAQARDRARSTHPTIRTICARQFHNAYRGRPDCRPKPAVPARSFGSTGKHYADKKDVSRAALAERPMESGAHLEEGRGRQREGSRGEGVRIRAPRDPHTPPTTPPT